MDLTGIDLTTETIRTERLVLRPFREDDVPAVLAACQDPDVQRWITAIPVPYTETTPRPSSASWRSVAGGAAGS